MSSETKPVGGEVKGWVAPLPNDDPRKQTLKVKACLGCGVKPEGHPGEANCLRAKIAGALKVLSEARDYVTSQGCYDDAEELLADMDKVLGRSPTDTP